MNLIFDKLGRELFEKYKWKVTKHKRGYAYLTRNQSGRWYSFHRTLMNCPPELVVDHINGNTLDNRIKNLRICTPSQNKSNRHRKTIGKFTSIYMGVSWCKNRKRWRAQISINGRCKKLGWFIHEKCAAIKYDEFAIKIHGEFAVPNIKQP